MALILPSAGAICTYRILFSNDAASMKPSGLPPSAFLPGMIPRDVLCRFYLIIPFALHNHSNPILL